MSAGATGPVGRASVPVPPLWPLVAYCVANLLFGMGLAGGIALRSGGVLEPEAGVPAGFAEILAFVVGWGLVAGVAWVPVAALCDAFLLLVTDPGRGRLWLPLARAVAVGSLLAPLAGFAASFGAEAWPALLLTRGLQAALAVSYLGRSEPAHPTSRVALGVGMVVLYPAWALVLLSCIG